MSTWWPPSSNDRASRSAGSGSASIRRRPTFSGFGPAPRPVLAALPMEEAHDEPPALERRRQVDLVDDLAAGRPRGPRLPAQPSSSPTRGRRAGPAREATGLARGGSEGSCDPGRPAPVAASRSRATSVAHTCLQGVVSNRGQVQEMLTPPLLARDVHAVGPRAPDHRLGGVSRGPHETHAAQGFVGPATLPGVAVELGFEGLGPEHGTSDVNAARLRREGPSASLHRRHLPAMHTLWRHGRP